MTFWDFAKDNPFMALAMVLLVVLLIRSIVRRSFRAACIYKHGWPANGVDADGDVPSPDTDDLSDEIADKVIKRLHDARGRRFA